MNPKTSTALNGSSAGVSKDLSEPYDFDFILHRFELVVGRHEFGFAVFGESCGEGIGKGQPAGGLIGCGDFGEFRIDRHDLERAVGGEEAHRL